MRILVMLPLCFVAACSGGSEEKKKEAAAETIDAGQWETSFEVTKFGSTDKTEPAVAAAVGDKATHPSCVPEAEKATPPPGLFAGEGYDCDYKNSYIRKGRITASLSCRRAGIEGEIMMSVDGSYKADSFEGMVSTTTYLPGRGDFQMERKLSGRKTAAACQAGEGGEQPAAKGGKGTG